jgi:hypothetical protein
MGKKSRQKIARPSKAREVRARPRPTPPVDAALRRREISLCVGLAVVCGLIYARVAGYPTCSIASYSG